MASVRQFPQMLIIDADDTLWENNVYFERAIDDFIAYLDHSTLTPVEVRAALDEIQRASIAVHGYGSRSFGQSLRECAERLHRRDLDDAELAAVMGFAECILSQPMQVIGGVEETLAALAPRHDLALLTKGHDEEQRLKIDRSGLAGYFSHAVVVPEKDAAVYRAVVADLGARPETTWMIGNSPRSDVNPALNAGLNAVFVPHDLTWRLEHQDLGSVTAPRQLLVIERFAQLRDHF